MARGKSSQLPNIRIVESSATELRLAEARAFVAAHTAARVGRPPRRRVARRGGRPGALDRGRVRRDDRAASLQPHPARRPARRAGSRGRGLSPVDLSRLRGGRRARRVRGAAGRARWRTSRRSRRRPASRARSPARCRSCGSPRSRPDALSTVAARRAGPRRAARALRRAVRRPRRPRDRATLFTVAADGGRISGSAVGVRPVRAAAAARRPASIRGVEFEFVARADRGLARRARDRPLRRHRHAAIASSRLASSPSCSSRRGHRPRRARAGTCSPDPAARARTPAGDVRFFSAPGEGRECVEIARRILQEVARRRAVRRDRRLRAGAASATSGCSSTPSGARRVGHVRPSRGMRPPGSIAARAVRIPAGRAFLAILACACEHLSARRFAEYLSLAQVPQLDGTPREFDSSSPDDEELVRMRERGGTARGSGRAADRDARTRGRAGRRAAIATQDVDDDPPSSTARCARRGSGRR